MAERLFFGVFGLFLRKNRHLIQPYPFFYNLMILSNLTFLRTTFCGLKEKTLSLHLKHQVSNDNEKKCHVALPQARLAHKLSVLFHLAVFAS